MLKYLCLFVLIAQIYCAPVDDTVITHAISSHGNEEVTNGVEQKPTKQSQIVEILESGSDHQTDGSYSFHYRGADGTFREETAVVKNPGTEQEYLEINGAYSFLDTDGKEVVVQYKADDKGFVPVGSNIPDIISVAARENSQLPAIKKDNTDDDDADVEDSEVTVLKKKESN